MVRSLAHPDQRFGVREQTNAETVLVVGVGGAQCLPRSDLRCGLLPGDTVREQQLAPHEPKRGMGEVVATRTLGQREQALVLFFDEGLSSWVPYERLACVKGPIRRLARGTFAPGLAEKFRLQTLAYALQHWNDNTGALSRLEVDPLPHQIHLVHHILNSGNLNWLIADDVGLGKTIEVGMLLAAREQKRNQSVLIVCPAGLTRQWKEELSEKFKMDDFVIYGRDFHINETKHWPMFRKVIASVDLLKHEAHLDKIQASGQWDMVIFDEAHKLSRRQEGNKRVATERYLLARALRKQTPNMLLLTATPHQGDNERFRALLELIRPEWKKELQTLNRNAGLLAQCIYRNRKIDVTDADGDFIFHGHETHPVHLPVNEADKAFDKKLRSYVRLGYRAAEEGGEKGRAIGFVMTTFRKLAASSYAAILRSLERRRRAIEPQQGAVQAGAHGGATRPQIWLDEEGDRRFEGEGEEQRAADASDKTGRRMFFKGEADMLDELIALARERCQSDRKVAWLTDELVPQLNHPSGDKKLLIFTEYRGTQDFIRAALVKQYGERAVALINGSMSVDEKRQAVQQFDEDVRFLISTEAGGEGLNLHRRCHVMVNFDLPWNPMRLVQRIGRLYRYGQKEKVLVFNLYSKSTLDADVVARIYSRIDNVVDDLAALNDAEYHDRLHFEIFGDIASLVDVSEVFDATRGGPERTKERIDAALARAKQAHDLQAGLLETARGYDASALSGMLALSVDHVQSFVLGMFSLLGAALVSRSHKGRVFELRLSLDLAAELGLRRQRLRLTCHRELQHLRDVEMMDFKSSLFKKLVERARDHAFNGYHASIALPGASTLMTSILRWQDAQGHVVLEEFVATVVQPDGRCVLNGDEVAEWLNRRQDDMPAQGFSKAQVAKDLDCVREVLEQRLAARSNSHLDPHQRWLLGAAWAGRGAAAEGPAQ